MIADSGSTEQTLPRAERPAIDPLQTFVPNQDMKLPIERHRPFRAIDYPRDPSEYTPTTHFVQRVKYDSERYLGHTLDEEPAFAETILYGALYDNEDGCGRFEMDHYGVLYCLIVGFHVQGYRVLITGYPLVVDREAALDSGFWLPHQLNEMEAQHEEYEQKDRRIRAFNAGRINI